MNLFFRDLLGSVRAVFTGRSDVAVARLVGLGPERLLAYQLLMTLLIAVQVSIAGRTAARLFTPESMVIGRSPFGVFVIPPVAAALTLLWALAYAALTGIERRALPAIFAIFLGSSLFLLPGIIPFIGPDLLVVLLVGWPAVLVRLLANHAARPPGRVFLLLMAPPVAVFVLTRLILWPVQFLLSR